MAFLLIFSQSVTLINRTPGHATVLTIMLMMIYDDDAKLSMDPCISAAMWKGECARQ